MPRSRAASRPLAKRATSRRTAATTPPRTSRARSRPASASSPSLLKHATVSEAEFDGTVEPGTVVTAIIAGDESTFLVGSREIVAEGSDLTVYSPVSPVGAAIVGLKAGDKATYTAPNGKEIAVEVVKVERYEP